MRLYNTLTRKVEEFTSLEDKKVGVYICGPTVYDYAHIGHARTYVNSDVLVRALRWLGYGVKVVMNITDVGHLTSDADTGEDKMEKAAADKKKSAVEIAAFFEADFFQMTNKLNIARPDMVCRATEHIPEMIDLIKILEDKGFTYKTADGIYFDTSKLTDYGKLARLDKEGLKAGVRVEVKDKRNLTDFALWKFSPAAGQARRQMEWTSPWGIGFPGWHIECSAMSMKFLGESFDIHTGGIDHVPVHHTNEIAQSEAATGKQFVKYWFHSGHLMIDGEKMSKSLGNFIRVADVESKGFRPLALRYLFLTGHYRTTMNFTWEALEAAQTSYKKLVDIVVGLASEKERTYLSEEKLTKADNLRQKFMTAVGDDLNAPQALAIVWETVKSNIPAVDKYDLLRDFDQVLGLGLKDLRFKIDDLRIPEEIQALIERREEVRKNGKFREADELRQEIEAKGYLIEDTSGGTKTKKINTNKYQ